MAKRVYYTHEMIKSFTLDIMRQIHLNKFEPDYIVGINRGGLTPALMISHFMDLPMYTLDVRLREGSSSPESNCWMSEDAYNYKNILIVDDINDSGATFNWIVKDWESSCHPAAERWRTKVWGNNVRFAVLTENLSSEFDGVAYCATEINKAEEDIWIVFPWEEWWGTNYLERSN